MTTNAYLRVSLIKLINDYDCLVPSHRNNVQVYILGFKGLNISANSKNGKKWQKYKNLNKIKTKVRN